MKRSVNILLVVALLILAGSCKELFFDEDPANSRELVFEQFWNGIDKTWPEFATKKVNWDSIYDVFRPQVTPTTPDQILLSMFQQMINSLEDAHVYVFPRNLPILKYQVSYPKSTYGFSWLRTHYIPEANDNQEIVHVRIHPDVGYIYIRGFGKRRSEYEIIDQILAEFRDVKGIIIDIRDNGGGSSLNSETIASRFVTAKTTYGFSRFRTGADRNAMSEFFAEEFEPDGNIKFLGKVVVLTGRATFSSAEDFALNMRAAGAILVGDNTRGGSGSKPILKELSNGWVYQVSTQLVHDLSKEPISNGIAPDLKIALLKADSVKGKDTILETAISEIIK